MSGGEDEPRRPRPPGSRAPYGVIVASCVGLALMLALVVWGAVSAWRLAGNAAMSIHGWIAMAIAGFGAAAMTGGLIALAFYSARKGYDDDQPF